MPITQFTPNPAPTTDLELPAPGFPFAEQELRAWFLRKYGREASSLEIGALMEAMAAQDEPDGTKGRQIGWGWRVEPAARPVDEDCR